MISMSASVLLSSRHSSERKPHGNLTGSVPTVARSKRLPDFSKAARGGDIRTRSHKDWVIGQIHERAFHAEAGSLAYGKGLKQSGGD